MNGNSNDVAKAKKLLQRIFCFTRNWNRCYIGSKLNLLWEHNDADKSFH